MKILGREVKHPWVLFAVMVDLRDGDEIEAVLGDWPRRLLHIPSMCSLLWQPGARYGTVKEPRYNAISYTWGRYQLEKSSEPVMNVKQPSGLKVHGVDWDIPVVKPEHFHPEQLHGALRAAMRVSQGYFFPPKNRAAVVEARDDVEFVWLDIACIDQRFNTASMLEIGRQAQIFSKAECVYVWLCRTSSEVLCDLWREYDAMNKVLRKAFMQAYVGSQSNFEPRLDEAWLHKAMTTIEKLTQDPWFGSLWTLQEAFICRRAVFLSREGDFAQEKADLPDDNVFTFRTTVMTIAAIFDIARKEEERSGAPLMSSTWQRLCSLYRDVGFEAMREENPMALYNAATLRRPSRETDRIYGIMQVFRFRLGESDPAAKPGAKFTLVQLEEQLGVNLVQFNPILSQSFIHTGGVRALGEHWRPGHHAMTPQQEQLDKMAMITWQPQELIVTCRMGSRRHLGVLWGYVAGLACSLEDFQRHRRKVEADLAKYDPKLVNFTATWIALDSAPDIFSGLSRDGDYANTASALSLLSTLSASGPGSLVKILHLGYWPEGPSTNNNFNAEVHYGLVLLDQCKGRYRSHLKDIQIACAPLVPNDRDWNAIEGLFG